MTDASANNTNRTGTTQANAELIAHSEEFRKDIIELAPGVYTAVGYAASTQHMIIGDDSVIIVDTSESTGAAENVLAEFRKITSKPVSTIIYTHSHRDHISGASVFAANKNVEVIAAHDFDSDLVGVDQSRPTPLPAMMARTKRQFGMGLSYPDERINLGCGPGDRPMQGMGAGFIEPTLSIAEERVSLSRAGVEMTLVKAPGETPDHMVVWLADKQVLICGDNYYKSFPNLYAIRGTSYRDFNAWADTLDLLMAFNAEVLAPGHSRPLFGADVIQQTLTDYRDAIKHVISETANGMNNGVSIDELAHNIKLPEALANKPYLREFYGKVSWAVRAYATGTLGWFDGNPTNLNRLSPREEALRVIQLAGGADNLLSTAQSALTQTDYQWAMEVADRLLAADEHTAEATRVKVQAMRAVADTEINATARNYYLLYSAETEQR
jgi:uncharacterized sulfatase